MNSHIESSFKGLYLFFFIFACIPDIVRTATTPATLKTCTATITGIQGIQGKVDFQKVNTGVQVSININGLQMKQDHTCHVHVNPVDTKNCLSAGTNFDKLNKQANCPNPQPQNSCQTGDLTGKGGKLTPSTPGASTSRTYLDTILTLPDISGKSIVVHDATGDYIACGNISCQ